MKKLIVILHFLIGISLTTTAQGDFSGPISDKMVKGLKSDASKLKDSIAFYSWAYELKIDRFKDSTIVTKISVNDSISRLIVKDHSYLKNINFISLLGKRRRATLIIPISVILTGYDIKSESVRKISFYDFSTRIRKLFNIVDGTEANENYIYFQPIMIYLSKTVYD